MVSHASGWSQPLSPIQERMHGGNGGEKGASERGGFKGKSEHARNLSMSNYGQKAKNPGGFEPDLV